MRSQAVGKDTGDENVAVDIQEASFSWSHDLPPVLSKVNVKVGKGELVAVMGSVGSGKSSLLCRLLSTPIFPNASNKIRERKNNHTAQFPMPFHMV